MGLFPFQILYINVCGFASTKIKGEGIIGGHL
jgi:hypothetical protein